MITGQLDTIIEVHSWTVTKKASGQEVKSYTKLIELFANVRHVTGKEGYQADQKVAESEIVFTIYDRVATIDEQMIVKHDSEFYEILAITPDRSKFYLELHTKKRDNQNIGS